MLEKGSIFWICLTIIGILIGCAIGFFMTAGLVWVVCWAFGWVFSWKYAIALYLLWFILSGRIKIILNHYIDN